MCWICCGKLFTAVFKEYNVERPYEIKHNIYLKYNNEVKQSKIKKFKSQL